MTIDDIARKHIPPEVVAIRGSGKPDR